MWCTRDGSNYVLNTRLNTGGEVATLNVGSRPIHLGIDGKQVAYILQNGTVAAWSSDSSDPTALMETPAVPDEQLYQRMPGGIVVSGTRVAALLSRERNEEPNTVVLFGLDTGTRELLTDSAFPAGIAMDGSYVVWAEVVGLQQSGIASFLRRPVADTTLMVYSAGTKAYTLAFAQRGQQGFPSISGRRLAWQDSASGSDDIYTALLPAGL